MAEAWKILALDDESVIIYGIQKILKDYSVEFFEDPEAACKAIKKQQFDILIVDYKMPKMNGIDFLIEAKKTSSSCYKILLTAYAEKEVLQDSINSNLVDKVIEKPLKSDVLLKAVEEACSACEQRRKEQEEIAFIRESYQQLKEELAGLDRHIIGIDGGLKEVFHKVESVARHPINILLTGETGTGKEVLAYAIHNMSEYSTGPFIKINCAAIPDTLMESELFGYVKGAFTDARTDKMGKIELANGGTLFLDEIGEIKLDLQSKLLRVLQEKEVVRLGSNRTVKVSFRLITATNKELREAIREKNFREDLYYRINTFPIEIPPLRERKQDIESLIRHFMETFSKELNVPPPRIAPSVFERLRMYSWPGNVRELENAVKRVVIVSGQQGEIRAEHFAFLGADNENSNVQHALQVMRDTLIRDQLSLQDVENMLLDCILDTFDNNIPKAVAATGIAKNKFYRHRNK